MKPDIHYQDPHIILCTKSAGIPSQPDPSGQEDLLTALQSEFGSISLIHRLDTPTGGIMVFGRTQKATQILNRIVQDHDAFQKDYLAILSAPPDALEGELKDMLFHDQRGNKSFVVDKARKGSKEAKLTYRVLHTLPDGHTLVLVRLHTGRTHQIRIQFASRGLPLLGDGKYGSREKCPFFALWAYGLSFPHPVTGNCVSAISKPDTSVLPWSLFADIIQDL